MNVIDAFTVTNDSVTVVYMGAPHVVKKGQPNFLALREALIKAVKSDQWIDWAAVPPHLKAASSLEKWARGRFKVVDSTIFYDGQPLPNDIQGRISDMASNGEDPSRFFKFWELLQGNPSMNSVTQLFRFLNNCGIPITSDGHFLAYKGVRDDYMDCHSGKIENRPGARITMPRNQISDDPNTPCHQGLHVGAIEYAGSFGPRVVICKVNPAHVVSVPNDHSSQKMRVCEYEVIGLHNGSHLPSTSVDDADLPPVPVQQQPKADAKPGAPASAKKRSKGFLKLDSMDETELMKCKLETLRAYAGRGLHIVGASRIPGGKWSLVQAIVKARG